MNRDRTKLRLTPGKRLRTRKQDLAIRPGELENVVGGTIGYDGAVKAATMDVCY